MIASCQGVFLVRFLARICVVQTLHNDAYIAVHTNYIHAQFSVMTFSNSLSVFHPSPAKFEFCVHGELLSSLGLASLTLYTATFGSCLVTLKIRYRFGMKSYVPWKVALSYYICKSLQTSWYSILESPVCISFIGKFLVCRPHQWHIPT